MAREPQRRARDRTSAPQPDDLPPVVPPRKHPWLLALVAMLLVAWLAFLAAMARFA